jgi:hypothetical protein
MLPAAATARVDDSSLSWFTVIRSGNWDGGHVTSSTSVARGSLQSGTAAAVSRPFPATAASARGSGCVLEMAS